MNGYRIAAVVLLALAGCARNGITVEDAWVRRPPPGAGMTAGYGHVINGTGQALIITGAEADGFGLAEFHRTEFIDGVARMREIEVLTVDAGKTLRLEPGGLHLMLMRPDRDPGDAVRIELSVRNGATIVFEAPVRDPAE